MKLAKYRVGEVIYFDGVGTIVDCREKEGHFYYTVEWDMGRLPVRDIIESSCYPEESSCYPEEMPSLLKIEEKVKMVGKL